MGHDAENLPSATVRRVRWETELEQVRTLFREYRAWVEDHQDTEASAKPRVRSGLALLDDLTAGLPGAYGPPRGDVLLWHEGENLVACGALREIEPTVGELKRIYVRADYRGPVFGPVFVRAMVERGRALGYERLKVDTLASMSAAIDFYKEMGFRPTSAFWPHPAAGALFFERRLRD